MADVRLVFRQKRSGRIQRAANFRRVSMEPALVFSYELDDHTWSWNGSLFQQLFEIWTFTYLDALVASGWFALRVCNKKQWIISESIYHFQKKIFND